MLFYDLKRWLENIKNLKYTESILLALIVIITLLTYICTYIYFVLFSKQNCFSIL